jgi:hypothetical protein
MRSVWIRYGYALNLPTEIDHTIVLLLIYKRCYVPLELQGRHIFPEFLVV